MENPTSYLNRLRFDEKLRNTFIAKYFSNPRFVFLIILSILAVGISSYVSLPRRLNPEIKIPIVVVSTVLPGAGPEDIESLVTEPLETKIDSVSDVSKVSSTSRDNVSVIQIEFESSVDPASARDDVQSAVDQVDLPDDAQSPTVQQVDFENQPVWSFTVTGPDPASLSRFSKELESRLEDSKHIKDVTVSGFEVQEVTVTALPEQIAAFGISPFQLAQLVSSAASSYPAGNVTTDTLSFPLAIDPAIQSISDVRNLQLNINGTIVPLSQLATVQEAAKPNQLQSFYADQENGTKQSVTFDVYKAGNSNINAATGDAEKIIDETLEKYGDDYRVKSVTNTGELIDEQFSELIRDFAITVTLVFVVLFIFLGARQAIVSLFTIPLTFLITFTVMRFSGISLNFLSMFSLLLSLGLLVDDTIVVISAMTSYFRTGKFTPLETGLLVWRDFGVAILTTTLTTVWAFLPLLLSSGIIGEFIKAIPIVVSSTLLASLFIAMIVTLPLMIILLDFKIARRVKILLIIILVAAIVGGIFALLPKGEYLGIGVLAFVLFVSTFLIVRKELFASVSKKSLGFRRRNKLLFSRIGSYTENGVVRFSRIENAYHNILRKILNKPSSRRATLIIVIIFSLFSYLLVPLGLVKNEFFPASDSDYIYVTLEMPAGTNLVTTKTESVKILEDLTRVPDVEYVTLDIGRAYSDTGGFTTSGENTALFSLVLPERSARDQSSIEIANDLRQVFTGYTRGELNVSEVSGGPPAGADVVIQLYGDDLATLDQQADKVVAYLEGQSGVIDVNKSVSPGTSKLVFEPDPEAMASLNMTPDQVAIWLRTYASGFSLDSIKFDASSNDNTDLNLRLGSSSPLDGVYTLSIPTPAGNVPLTELGTLNLSTNPTTITRSDGQRTLSVSASVKDGYNISEINTALGKYADSDLNLPSGYTWTTGGVNEENQESVTSILTAMLLSFMLIIVTMVVQFGSFRKSILVMLVIPLSISGVFIIFALTHTPLSFPALIGILALFGIVVKNSILVVDKITANERIGMKFVDAIVDGAESRLEAITLTSITAIIGLIPITLSDPLWRGLGGAIIAGLTFSGTIMLFFIPVVYYYFFAGGEKGKLKVKN